MSNSNPVIDGYILSYPIFSWYLNEIFVIPSWNPRTVYMQQKSWPEVHITITMRQQTCFQKTENI